MSKPIARSRCAPAGPTGERGVALVWAVVCVMVIAGILAAASDENASLETLTRAEFASRGQAQSIARAGLADALAWLRRKTTRPVTNFDPARDPRIPPPEASATPESIAAAAAAAAADSVEPGEQLVNETENEAVGIVRTFEISPGIWGRYSVIRGTSDESFTDENGNGAYDDGEPFADADGDGRWSPARWSRDVSAERGLTGAGSVWYLACRGEVFQRSVDTQPLGVGTNKRLAEATVATEVRRLTIAPPAAATIVANRGDEITVGLRARVRGDTCLAFGSGTGSPAIGSGEVQGGSTSLPAMSLAVEDVFGVSWAELRSMADISTDSVEAGVPTKLPDASLTVITGDAAFDADHPLRGNGVVCVQGDVDIAPSSNSFFNGVLYVQGDLTVRAPAFLRGTILVTGEVDLRGTGGDFCEFEHDPTVVSLLLTRIGQYRHSKAIFAPQPRLPDGRPSTLGLGQRRFGGAP
jgi:hypothetical protein